MPSPHYPLSIHTGDPSKTLTFHFPGFLITNDLFLYSLIAIYFYDHNETYFHQNFAISGIPNIFLSYQNLLLWNCTCSRTCVQQLFNCIMCIHWVYKFLTTFSLILLSILSWKSNNLLFIIAITLLKYINNSLLLTYSPGYTIPLV